MKKPLFSCVIPVKGRRPFFDEALQSLYAQGMGDDLEIIVQDADIEPDKGQSDALNKGFAKARGEWLFWLNADDVLLPGALEKVRDFINRAERVERVEWIVGNQLLIDDHDKVLKCSVGNRWHDCLYRHSVPHVYGPSSFFRRELFDKVGGFDATLHFCMDWDLWIKFMKVGARFKRINDYVWAQRQWLGSKTQRSKSKSEAEKQWAEIRSMLAKNGIGSTTLGAMQMRFWRFLNGNMLRQAVDLMKFRGKHYSEVCV